MPHKQSLGHGRAILLEAIMNRNLSENIAYQTSEIIKNTRERQGSAAADRKAEELAEIINVSETEAEILEAISYLKEIKESIPTHERALMIRTCVEKGLSSETHDKLCEIVKNIRMRFGYEAAEKKAEELTEIINSHETEAELFEVLSDILANMKPVPTHSRALLLKLTTDRGMSEDVKRRISEIIKIIRLRSGHDAAEHRAEEIMKIINSHETEDEILKAVETMNE